MPTRKDAVSFVDVLADTPVSGLDLTRYVDVDPGATVAETVGRMRETRRSCALVVDGPNLHGLFTERDVQSRIIGRPNTWDRRIAEEMTTSVRNMDASQSVGDGLNIMIDWWVRNVPVLDRAGAVAGNLSFYTVMETIAGMLTSKSDDVVEEELRFVDFTGLNVHHPVTVNVADSVEVAAHHMKARGIGSVLVTDDRGSLVGVVTEFDLLVKVGCDTADLASVGVSDVMTPDPVSISARSSIATAIEGMAQRGFNHVPLEGESGKPVGVISFRDVASFLEAGLESSG